VAKEIKRTEALATEQEDWPKWCKLPEDRTRSEDILASGCERLGLSPLKILYPSVVCCCALLIVS